MALSEDRMNELSRILEERGAILPCPRCGKHDFLLVNGYCPHSLQDKTSGLTLGVSSIPTVVSACTNCGFLSFHAVGVLETLPSVDNNGAKDG